MSDPSFPKPDEETISRINRSIAFLLADLPIGTYAVPELAENLEALVATVRNGRRTKYQAIDVMIEDFNDAVGSSAIAVVWQ